MLFKRVQFTSAGQELPTKSRTGTGFLDQPVITPVATDAPLTLTTAQMSGGIVTFTSFTAGRNVTTPTAAQIFADAPDMDIGDAFTIQVSTLTAFAATWVAGANVTLAGRATTVASGNSTIVVTKNSATTVIWTVL